MLLLLKALPNAVVVGLLASVLILACGHPRHAGDSPSALSACQFCALLPWESVQGRSQRARRLAPSPPSLLHPLATRQSATAAWTSEHNKTSERSGKKTVNGGRSSRCGLPNLTRCRFRSSQLRLAYPVPAKGKKQRKHCQPMKRTVIDGIESEIGSSSSPPSPPVSGPLVAGSSVPVLQRT